MSFEMKKWLDQNVVPLTRKHVPSKIHSLIWKGTPPDEILVWLLTGDDQEATATEGGSTPFNPKFWPTLVHKLIVEDGFRFDYLREHVTVPVNGEAVSAFGCDGAPLVGKNGMASVRVYRKMDDGIGLILQIGSKYPGVPELKYEPAKAAAQGIKDLFARFEGVDPLEVCSQYSVAFGAA